MRRLFKDRIRDTGSSILKKSLVGWRRIRGTHIGALDVPRRCDFDNELEAKVSLQEGKCL